MKLHFGFDLKGGSEGPEFTVSLITPAGDVTSKVTIFNGLIDGYSLPAKMALAVGVGRGQTAVRIIGEREAASRTSTSTSFTTSTSIPSRLAHAEDEGEGEGAAELEGPPRRRQHPGVRRVAVRRGAQPLRESMQGAFSR